MALFMTPGANINAAGKCGIATLDWHQSTELIAGRQTCPSLKFIFAVFVFGNVSLRPNYSDIKEQTWASKADTS